MTDAQKAIIIRAQVDTDITDATIDAYLAIAGDRVLLRLYPYGATVTTVPTMYEYLQCVLAARMINRIGAEGEISHSENGISRTWDSASDEDVLSQIISNVGVIEEDA